MGKKNFAKEKMFETENWKRRENISKPRLSSAYPQVHSSHMHCSFRGILDNMSGSLGASSSSRESGV